MIRRVAIAIFSLALAGCSSPLPAVPDYSTIEHVEEEWEQAQGIVFPAPRVTNSKGLPITEFILPDNLPQFVQQLLPGEGGNPSLDLRPDGHALLNSFDRVWAGDRPWSEWRLSHDFKTPGFPTVEDRRFAMDSMMATDPATGRTFLLHFMAPIWQELYDGGGPWSVGSCFWIAYTDDGGSTWTEPAQAGTSSSSPPGSCASPAGSLGWGSRPKIVGGPRPAADVVPAPGSLLYLCDTYWTDNYERLEPRSDPPFAKCSVSADAGVTWTRVGIIDDGGRSAPLGRCFVVNLGRPIAHRDGTIWMPVFRAIFKPQVRSCPLGVAVSRDGGTTWSIRESPDVPETRPTELEPRLAFSPDETTAYVAYNSNGSVFLWRSTDGFQSWQGPFRVSPRTMEWNVRATLAVGSSSRVAVGYLAAPRNAMYPFVSTSFDADAADPTFITQQVTPNRDPVAPVAYCDVGFGIRGSPEHVRVMCPLGKSIDMALDGEGRLLFAYSDGCTPRTACPGDFQAMRENNIFDRQLAVTIQVSGQSLLNGDKEVERWTVEPSHDMEERRP